MVAAVEVSRSPIDEMARPIDLVAVVVIIFILLARVVMSMPIEEQWKKWTCSAIVIVEMLVEGTMILCSWIGTVKYVRFITTATTLLEVGIILIHIPISITTAPVDEEEDVVVEAKWALEGVEVGKHQVMDGKSRGGVLVDRHLR